MKLAGQSRVQNTTVNIIFGFGAQICILIFSLINRAVFVRCFNPSYLGINGLYGNILALLSLTEFGIGNVMVYSLYKPVADKDYNRINALLNFYKKVYIYIAGIVLIIGVLFIPFLRHIVKSDLSFKEMVLYYILYLLSSVASYIGAYRSALLNAEQKAYIIKIISTVVLAAQNIVQILVLIFFKSYIIYLITMVCCTYLTNIILNTYAKKLFSYLKQGTTERVNDISKIFSNMKGAFGYQLGSTIIRSTDNILISAIFGTAFVGLYSNYYMIISNVINYINIISSALMGSLGNLNAVGDKKKSYKIFKVLLLFFHWLAAACSLSMWFIFNDWIQWWVGEKYLLSHLTVMMIILDFYINIMLYPTWLYRETSGLFKQMKYIMLIAAVVNIAFSVILGKFMGLSGIFLGTIICRISTYVWYEPKLLYKNKFEKSVKEYWKIRFQYFLMTAISIVVCNFIFIPFESGFLFMLLKGVICFTVTAICFFAPKIKGEEVQYLYDLFKQKRKRLIGNR